jgi:hypothetical protein
MRMSEAMRLGAALRPQHFGDFFESAGAVTPGTDDASCALFAAFEAQGIAPTPSHGLGFGRTSGAATMASHSLQLPDEWGWTAMTSGQCPECGTERPVLHLVSHLNDDHRWTRERIADWLEPQEPVDQHVSTQNIVTKG